LLPASGAESYNDHMARKFLDKWDPSHQLRSEFERDYDMKEIRDGMPGPTGPSFYEKHKDTASALGRFVADAAIRYRFGILGVLSIAIWDSVDDWVLSQLPEWTEP